MGNKVYKMDVYAVYRQSLAKKFAWLILLRHIGVKPEINLPVQTCSRVRNNFFIDTLFRLTSLLQFRNKNIF